MKRPHFLYHESDFEPKPRPRYAHPFNWPVVIGVAISFGIMGGCLYLVYLAMHFYRGLQ